MTVFYHSSLTFIIAFINCISIIPIIPLHSSEYDQKNMQMMLEQSFHTAIAIDDPQTVTTFIAQGVDINSLNTMSSFEPTGLMNALILGHDTMVQLLLKNKANPNKTDLNKTLTPLIIALRNRNTKAIQMLLEAKADVEVRDNCGLTPLAIATIMNNIHATKLLLEAKADPNSIN